MKKIFFNDSLVELIKSKNYKESSIKQYSINVKRLANVLTMGKNVPEVVDRDYMKTYFVINSEAVLRNDITNVNSLAACAYAAFVVLDCYDLKEEAKYYKELSKKYLKENSEITIYREPNEKEQENFMSMEDLQCVYIKLKNEIQIIFDKNDKNFDLLKKKYNFLNLFQRYLVCALYTQYPPLRGQDYYNTKFVRDDEGFVKWKEENIYDLRTGTLLIRHHKTENALGTKILKMPQVIVEICKDWSCINETENFLFNTKNSNPLSQQAFTALLNRTFSPYKVSSSMLRKIYISWFLNQNPSVEERKRTAKIMGHQIALQEFVYSRFRSL